MLGSQLGLGLDLGSESRIRVLICLSEPSTRYVKVSHVIFEFQVINHRPEYYPCNNKLFSLFSYCISHYFHLPDAFHSTDV